MVEVSGRSVVIRKETGGETRSPTVVKFDFTFQARYANPASESMSM